MRKFFVCICVTRQLSRQPNHGLMVRWKVSNCNMQKSLNVQNTVIMEQYLLAELVFDKSEQQEKPSTTGWAKLIQGAVSLPQVPLLIFINF